jgi:hypothetical protein
VYFGVSCPQPVVLRRSIQRFNSSAIQLLSSSAILRLHLALKHRLALHQPAHALDLLVDLRASARGILKRLWLLHGR